MADDNAPRNGSQRGHPEARVSETEDTPTSRAVEPLPEGEKPDQLAEHLDKAEDRQEALIDESLEESFPASDPPSAKKIT
ncbi:hypothetical protein PMI01_03454 [Caulobacter sp. AP07]|uniref:hypothetical protein n=1 Tax=Caulobacter sp. AP07 TaxID=1144304 RepID=UPI000271DA25|nr:hypothetical protein [Caulobacter sp. AP07]EJL28791.1 hypothetical protein PMI01_03454 [Caulobacter sp. AP07]